MGSHSSPFESSDILQLFISTFLLSSASRTQNQWRGIKYFGNKNEVCYHHCWGRHPAYADLNGEWSTGQSPPLGPHDSWQRRDGECNSGSDCPPSAPCCSFWGYCGSQSPWCTSSG